MPVALDLATCSVRLWAVNIMARKRTWFTRGRPTGATKRIGRMGASKGKYIGGPGYKIGRPGGRYKRGKR